MNVPLSAHCSACARGRIDLRQSDAGRWPGSFPVLAQAVLDGDLGAAAPSTDELVALLA